jgi:hypothetical protein
VPDYDTDGNESAGFTRGAPLKVESLFYYPQGLVFSCFVCGLKKKGKHVASLAGEEAKMVCQFCYETRGYVQLPAREAWPKGKSKRGKAEAKSTTEPRPAQPPGTIKAAKKNKPQVGALPLSDQEARRLQLRIPAIGHLVAFFEAAGATVQLLPDMQVRVNGQRPRRLPKRIASLERGLLNSLIDQIALENAHSLFTDALRENACLGDGVRAVAKRKEKGFAVTRGGTELGFIRATTARAHGGDLIEGNFLIPGTHWSRLAEAIASVVARREGAAAAVVQAGAPLGRRAEVRRITALPSEIDPAFTGACIDASRRIRTERQVAYQRPVVLESAIGELTLLPIISTGVRLLLPFRLAGRSESLAGQLELILGDPDPLPLLVDRAVPDEDAIGAWACALTGFADATCIEIEPAVPRPRAAQRSASAGHQRGAPVSAAPRRRAWPSHLEPIGTWILHAGSFVAGHRRRLDDDKTASDEARERALRVGIMLGAHQTWVRPHSRGIPEGIEMRFRWHAPEALLLRDVGEAKTETPLHNRTT